MWDFKKNNEDNIKKLDEYLEKNSGNIYCMITSLELFYAIKEELDNTITKGDSLFYNNVRVINDYYMPPTTIRFIKKKPDDDIRFRLWEWEEPLKM